MAAILAAPLVGLGLSTTAATTLATAGLYIATTGASILLQMAMAEKTEQEIGTKLSAVLGGAVNQAIHVGRKETAGSFIYKGTWGVSGRVPNGFLVRIYALSDRPVIGFEDYVWVDGIKCGYDPEDTDTVGGHNIGHNIPKFNASGGHRLWVKFHDGTQGSADNYLVSKFGSGAREWTNDHVGVGRAYMIVTQKYDKKAPTGEVEVTAVVKNTSLYDWRNDSTNGGSGAQRYSNQATWGTDPGNPITNAYNVMRGIYYGDEWMYGGQKWPPTRFDNDTWTAAANKCDTDVDTVGAGTIKWARQGAEIDVSEEPWAVVERMLKASNGRMVESGGKFKVYVGGIGASVYSFTDDDVILSEELTGQLFPTRDSIANTVNGTYVEPENAGEAKAYKPRSKTEYVDEDGDVRKTTMDFEYVRDNRQAQRLAAQALKENRRFRTFSLAFWSQARKLEPCDVISWTSEQYQFTAKKFIVGDVVLRDDGIVIVNVREADASDADWNPITDEDPFTTGVFEDLDEPTQTFAATVTAVPFKDDTGKDRRPAIRIDATLDDEFVDCRALRYQVRKKFHDQKIIHRGRSMAFFEPDNEDYGDITFTSNAIATLKAKWVQVRYKIEPESDRETEWSDWADHDVNLDDLGLDDDDTSDSLLTAPTGLSVSKVQDKDEDGTIKTFLKLNCTPPAWAGAKVKFIYEVEVASDDTYRETAADGEGTKARFRVQKTGRLHTVRVRAKSGVGQLSAWTSSLSITPSKKGADASAITGVSIARKNGFNIIKWDRVSDPDNREIAVMRGTTNVLGSMTEIGRTKATKWRDDDNIVKGTRYYYRLLPVDTSDNVGSAVPSAAVDDVETGIILTDTDTTLLAAPTGISLSQANRDVDKDGTVDIALLTTFSGGVSGAAGYEMQWLDSAGQTASARADSGSAWFKANTQRSYQARWRTITWNGQPGSWSSYTGSVTPAATTGAPANPSLTSVVAGSAGYTVAWSAPTELDYAYSEIASNISGTTPTSSQINQTISGTAAIVFNKNPNNYYVFVRHVNTSGLKSSWVMWGSILTAKTFAGVSGNFLGASGSGSTTAMPTADDTLITISWICDNSASGVSIVLGSRTYNGIQFELDQPMCLQHVESGGGSFSVNKTGGSWRAASLTAVAYNNA
jgi:hypothetical protein